MASRNPTSARPTGRWNVHPVAAGGHRTAETAGTAGSVRAFDLVGFLAWFRRHRFAGGLFCPRCDGREVQRWGGFADRRRYRCLSCGRTFSDLTGTPMAYLKRLEGWASFCHCMQHSWSVRRTATTLQVAVSTAFRWRHRLLDALRATDVAQLEGDVALAETWFAFSEKGRRNLDRPGRRRGELWPGERAWVLLARDARGCSFAALTGTHRPRIRELGQALGGRLEPDVQVCHGSGPLGPVARFARARGLGYRRLRGARLGDNPAAAYGVEVRRWLWRFRGVATRYLPNYLAWHRFLALSARGALAPHLAPTLLLACEFP